jgi:hypothetical protein
MFFVLAGYAIGATLGIITVFAPYTAPVLLPMASEVILSATAAGVLTGAIVGNNV